MNFRVYYKHIFSRIASKWAVLLVDIMLVLVSMFLACILQYGFSSLADRTSLCVWMIVVTALCNVCSFHVFRTYVGIIRYSSFVDICQVFRSLTLGYALAVLVNFCYSLLSVEGGMSYRIFVMAYIFTFASMLCMRTAIKILYEKATFDKRHCVNVFIYGFHGTGVNVAKSLRVNRNNHYRLCGFISDEPDMVGKHTMGCRVYPNDERLSEYLKKKNVHTVIISPSTASDLERSKMLDKLSSYNVQVMIVPSLTNRVDDGAIKDIKIEDWLRREPVQINMRKTASYIEGRRIMVIGAAGTVGRELVRQLAMLNPYQLILVDQAESPLYDVQLELSDHWKNLSVRVLVADVVNRTRMEAIYKETRPHLVFHAAAYNQVQLMDEYVSEAIQTNVLGTVNVTDLAMKYRVRRMIMISTDKTCAPGNMVEYSKCLAEKYVQSYSNNLNHKNGDGTGMIIAHLSDELLKPVCNMLTLPEVCMRTIELGVTGNKGEIDVCEETGKERKDSINQKKEKRGISEAANCKQMRKDIWALIEHSYTGNAVALADEMKKIVADI